MAGGGAFNAALVAQAGGNATGQIQAYKDQVAQAAQTAQMNQQQQQFDASQAEAAREFNIDADMNKGKAKIDADNAERIRQQWLPADPKTHFPGGLLWQQAQQSLKAGGIANATGQAELAGKNLGNQAQSIQNQWAPIMNNLQVVTGQLAVTNNIGRDPASEQQRALQLQQAAAGLQKDVYKYEKSIDVLAAGVDKTQIVKEYGDAQKGLSDALKGLDTKGANALGKPENIVGPMARQKAADYASSIQSAPDPFAAADQAIASMPKDSAAPYVANYLAAVARETYIRRKMLGQPAAGAAAGPTSPGSIPYGLNLQTPGAFGASLGGSQAATPFARP